MPKRPNIRVENDPVKQAPRLLTCRPGQAILTGKDKLVALKVHVDYGKILVDTGHRVDLLYLHAKKQIFPGIFISVERIFSNGVFRVSIEEKSPSPEGTR